MSDEIARSSIAVSVDGSGVESGVAKIDRSIKNLGKSISDVSKGASKNINDIGTSSGAASNVDKTTKQIIQSIQRQTAAFKAGSRGTAEYFEAISSARGANLDVLRPYIAQLKEAQTQAGALTESNRRLKGSMSDVSTQANTSKGLFSGLSTEVGLYARSFIGLYAAIGTGRAILNSADAITKLNGQLKNATSSQVEFGQAFANVQSIAQRSQTDIGAVGSVYARLSNALRDLGASQSQVSDVTETLALALKVNGATASETAATLLQLSQAFGKGKLDGDEFRSAMEAAPNVMRELAKSLNVPFGSLKDLAAQGKITSDVLLTAFTNPQLLSSLTQQAQGMRTLGGSVTVAKNEIGLFAGTILNSSGITNGFGTIIDVVASNFATLNRQISGTKKGIDALFPSYQKFIEAENKRNGISPNAAPVGIAIPKGAPQGEVFSTGRPLQGIAISPEEVKRLNDAKTAYAALTGEIKLYSSEVAKQETIKKNADASLKANLISQTDYNRIIQDANEKIKSLNGEKSKNAKVSSEVRAQLKIESDEARNLATSYAELIKQATALTAPQETQAQQLQRLIDGYNGLDKSVRSYVEAQILAAENNEFAEMVNADARAIDAQIEAITSQAKSLEDENASYGKLPSAIQDVTIARLRDKKAMLEGLGLGTEEINRQIEAYERLKEAMTGREILEAEKARVDAAKKANDEIIRDTQRAAEENNRSITDALLRGFESGANSAENFRRTLVNTFRTLVLRPVISFLVDGSGINKVMAALTGALGSSTATAGGLVDAGGGFGGIMKELGGLGDIFNRGNDMLVGSIEKLGTFLSTGTGGLGDVLGGFLGQNAGAISSALPFANVGLQLLQGNTRGAIGAGLGAALSLTPLGAVGGIIGSVLGGGLFGGKKQPPRTITQLPDVSAQFTNTLNALTTGLGARQSQFSVNQARFAGRSGGSGYGFFNATVNGANVGDTIRYKGDYSDASMQKFINTVLVENVQQAIANLDISAGIKKFFGGLTTQQDIANTINSVVALNKNLRGLPPVFNQIRNALNTTAYTTAPAELEQQFNNTLAFTSLFYSEQENFATFTKQLTNSLSDLNTSLPATREGFRSLVDGLMSDFSENGRRRFAGLVSLSTAADQYYKQLEAQILQANELANQGRANLNQNSFSTVVDLQRYRAARSELGAQAANANVNEIGTQIVTNAELAALLKQMVAALNSTANNTKVTSAHLYEVIAGNSTMKVSNS